MVSSLEYSYKRGLTQVNIFSRASKNKKASIETPLVIPLTQRKNPPNRDLKNYTQAYSDVPIVRSALLHIAESVGSTTWELYSAKSPGKAKRMRRANNDVARKLVDKAIDAGSLDEVDDHELLDFLARGNPVLDGRRALEITQLLLDIHGEAYWYCDHTADDKPYYFWPMPVTWLEKAPGKDGGDYSFRISPTQTFKAPSDRVVRFSLPNPNNPYGRGVGIVEAIVDDLDIDEYVAKFQKTFFYNDATPSRVVSVDGLNKDEKELFEAKWLDHAQGVDNAHRTIFLNREVKIHETDSQVPAADCIALRKASRDIVVQALGMPPEVLGILDGGSNRSTIEGGLFVYALLVVTPRQDRLLATIQNTLVTKFDPSLVLSYVSTVPEDKDRLQAQMIAGRPFVTRAEWRESMGYESHGASDEVYLMGFADIEKPANETASQPLPDPPDARLPVAKAKALGVGELDQIVNAFTSDQMAYGTDQLFKAEISQWGSQHLVDLGITDAFSMSNPRVIAHLEELAGDRISGIVTDTTREALRAELSAGVAAGEGPRDLAARVGTVFTDASKNRARTIARTEVVRSSGFGSLESYKQSGLPLKKRWIATHDDKTRDEHLAIESQTRDEPIDLDDDFAIGNDTAASPCEFSQAANSVNCRCTVVSVSSDDDERNLEADIAIWKQYDADITAWEKSHVNVLQMAFADQETQVLAELLRQTRSQ